MHQLKARVIDAENKEPLVAATVAVIDHSTKKIIEHNGRKLATITDDNGAFILNIPTLDFDDVAIQYIGYQTLYTDPRTIQTTPVISLQPKAFTLQPVEVTGTPRPKKEPKQTIPEWIWAIAIPLGFCIAYLIYKYLNHGKTGNAQPASKLR